MRWSTARATASLLALAAAGCLDPPSEASFAGADAATDCRTIFRDTFDGSELGTGWKMNDGSLPVVVADGSIVLAASGDEVGDGRASIYTSDTLEMGQLTVTLDEVVPRIDAGGTILVELSPEDNADFYSFYAYSDLLGVFDSSRDLCEPACPALVEDEPQRWRFHPSGDVISFEIDIGDAWEVIDTAPLRGGLYRVTLAVDTDAAADLASLQVGTLTVTDCTD